MSKYNFSAGGVDFGNYEGDSAREAAEKFAIDAGYRSWQAMVDQAVELSGENNVEVREVDDFGRPGPVIDMDKAEDTIPESLRDQLPADLDLSRASTAIYWELCNGHDVDTDQHADIDTDALVVIAAGYVADDGNCEVEYADAESAAEAAQDYVDGGVWDDVDSTSWIHVYAWRRGYVLDEDGELVRLTIDRDSHTAAIEPDEPECDDDGGHDWQSPYEVLGGIEENPGVWGNGGGVIIREVCAHCGRYRETDTWAQDPSTGEQGLTSVRYEDADEASERWAADQAE